MKLVTNSMYSTLIPNYEYLIVIYKERIDLFHS